MTPRRNVLRAPRVIAWSSTRPRSARTPGSSISVMCLKPRGNVLEIEVTNLASNRVRDLDVRKAPWKLMREINLVTVKYRPFDAAGWQIEPAGLLGPVTLVPLARFNP